MGYHQRLPHFPIQGCLSGHTLLNEKRLGFGDEQGCSSLVKRGLGIVEVVLE